VTFVTVNINFNVSFDVTPSTPLDKHMFTG